MQDVIQNPPKMVIKISNVCRFCKDRCAGTLCSFCRTKAQRKEQILEQLDIEKENKDKGRNIPDKLFGFNRKKLLEIYEVKS